MNFEQLFFGSLLVASFLLPIPLLSQSAKKCETITRAKIEEKLGKAVKCSNISEDVECFEHERGPIRVEFNSADVVTSIEMTTGCNGLQSLIKVLDELVPKSARGKYLRELQISPSGSCGVVREGEYQCLKIRYFQELCMGCAPASIKATWK